MNKLALGASLIGIIAACGGGKVQLIDAGADAPMACDPVAQSGCMAGEKCTWIVDLDGSATQAEIGHIGCAASGAVLDGAACTDATAATNGGVDGCVRGDLCISKKCKPICDPQVVTGATGGCTTNYACSSYAGVFTISGPPVAGVCEPTCDPLTQKLNVGTTNLEACGSVDPTMPTGTCVIGPGFTSFVCAPAVASVAGKTDRVPPLADSAGNIYGNGCAPGYIPFYFEDASGANKTVCSGMCAPLKVDQDIATGDHVDDNRGDKTALGKLPGDATSVAGHATCDSNVKGSTVSPTSSPRGEDCRYIWFGLAQGVVSNALQTPYNDTLGVCFAYENYHDIRVPGIADLQQEKSCAELPAVAPSDTDPYGSAKDNGCYPLAQSQSLRRNVRRTGSFRLANGGSPLMVRHVFD